jgi:hypothetical protein
VTPRIMTVPLERLTATAVAASNELPPT